MFVNPTHFPFSLPFPPSSEGSPYSVQVGLELLGSNNPPASASHIIKIVGSCYCILNVYEALRQKNRMFKGPEAGEGLVCKEKEVIGRCLEIGQTRRKEYGVGVPNL